MMATADLERELTALHEEIRELETSIRQQGNVMHSTPRPREMEIRDNYDSGIASGRPSSIIHRSPLADHFPDAGPDRQFDYTRPKVRFNEEMDTRDETNRNGIGSGVNTGNVNERRNRRPTVQGKETETRRFNRREVKAATYDEVVRGWTIRPILIPLVSLTSGQKRRKVYFSQHLFVVKLKRSSEICQVITLIITIWFRH